MLMWIFKLTTILQFEVAIWQLFENTELKMHNKHYLRLNVGDQISLLFRQKMLMRIFLNIQDDMQFRKPVRHEEKCPAFCLFPSRVPELFHHFRQRWLFPRKNINDDYYGNTGCGVFKEEGTKIELFLHKNQHTQMKLLNFEFWINGELSKIVHHFIKNVYTNKNVL